LPVASGGGAAAGIEKARGQGEESKNDARGGEDWRRRCRGSPRF